MNEQFFINRFETSIFSDTSWVSYNHLGNPQYTKSEIAKLVNGTPEVKQQNINSIPDAIQLFIACNFIEVQDVNTILISNINWEIPLAGRNAVLSNKGCCSAAAAWINYILKDKFDEMGFIQIIRDQDGHVINYFKDEEWYYVFDIFPFIGKYQFGLCNQTGLLADFIKTKFITANLIKTCSLDSYAYLLYRFFYHRYSRLMFLKCCTIECLPIGHDMKNRVYIPENKRISIIGPLQKANNYEWVNCSGYEFFHIYEDVD